MNFTEISTTINRMSLIRVSFLTFIFKCLVLESILGWSRALDAHRNITIGSNQSIVTEKEGLNITGLYLTITPTFKQFNGFHRISGRLRSRRLHSKHSILRVLSLFTDKWVDASRTLKSFHSYLHCMSTTSPKQCAARMRTTHYVVSSVVVLAIVILMLITVYSCHKESKRL